MKIGSLANSHCISCGGNCLGKDGGLMFFTNDVNLVIIDSNKNLIDFYIMFNNNNNNKYNHILWRGTTIYGYYKINQSVLTCYLVNNLAQRSIHPNWLIFSDLNIIISNNEKVWGKPTDLNLTHTINNTFYVYYLFDI